MSTVSDIFNRVAERNGWTKQRGRAGPERSEDDETSSKDAKVKQWNEIMKSLHAPFEAMTGTMIEGLQHVSYTLELSKPPKNLKKKSSTTNVNGAKDIEADAGSCKPGSTGFSDHLRKRIENFHQHRQETLKVFTTKIPMPNHDEKVEGEAVKQDITTSQFDQHKTKQRQLYMVLYMEFLLWSTGRAVLDFVNFADEKARNGTMKKKRMIFPGKRRFTKWLVSLWQAEDPTSADQSLDVSKSGEPLIFQTKKDPEHLPPRNAWEKYSDVFRSVSMVARSKESAFGLRVACATLTIGIVDYLEKTQHFFLTQRLVWSMIMVAIGMTVSVGAGLFGFLARILGTLIAMCTSLVIWYIVDGHTPGVIVFLLLFSFIEFYFMLRYPKFLIVAILVLVTQVLIIGYELQVHKVGLKAATSSGQPYYETYLLAPYRLACVAGGMLVAFIWTFIPYPVTERGQFRQDLGASLYQLADFYSVVHTSVRKPLSAAWYETP